MMPVINRFNGQLDFEIVYRLDRKEKLEFDADFYRGTKKYQGMRITAHNEVSTVPYNLSLPQFAQLIQYLQDLYKTQSQPKTRKARKSYE